VCRRSNALSAGEQEGVAELHATGVRRSQFLRWFQKNEPPPDGGGPDQVLWEEGGHNPAGPPKRRKSDPATREDLRALQSWPRGWLIRPVRQCGTSIRQLVDPMVAGGASDDTTASRIEKAKKESPGGWEPRRDKVGVWEVGTLAHNSKAVGSRSDSSLDFLAKFLVNFLRQFFAAMVRRARVRRHTE
jgi:hypothetical protein